LGPQIHEFTKDQFHGVTFVSKPVLLTVVTVVFNDPAGLRKTLASVQPHLGTIEHWIIDGSTTNGVRRLVAEEAHPGVHLLSEPDHGLYDAMNKGLERATGDYVLFLNAGDVFVPSFDPSLFLRASNGQVVIGHCLERHADDLYLRPARGREADVAHSPAHPATAYPRSAYQVLRFDVSKVVNADGLFTRDSIAVVGFVMIKEVVSEFELGGRSSNYGDWQTLRCRLTESTTNAERLRLISKALLWILLPQRQFYRLLAFRKYERVTRDEIDHLMTERGAVGCAQESSTS
jgi:putative colanic acid biosynthesis glycosyltransferase